MLILTGIKILRKHANINVVFRYFDKNIKNIRKLDILTCDFQVKL